MQYRIPICLFIGLLLCQVFSYGQAAEESSSGKILNFPSLLFNRVKHKTVDLNQQLTKQTEKYLARLAKREARIQKKLIKVDSTAAKNLFADAGHRYAALAQKLRQDTGSNSMSVSGEYQPYTDSLKGTLSFLQQNLQLLGASDTMAGSRFGIQGDSGANIDSKVLSRLKQEQLQSAVSELQALQAKLQDADQVKQYIRERKEQISQTLSKYSNLPGSLTKELQGMGKEIAYYSLQVREYRDLLNSPDKLEHKALSLLNQLPAFQNFMKSNGALAGL
ncbi:hypothetical protein ACX0G9_23020, partial [Flavitalea flava]